MAREPKDFKNLLGGNAKGLSDYCNAHRDDDIIKAAEAVMPVK